MTVYLFKRRSRDSFFFSFRELKNRHGRVLESKVGTSFLKDSWKSTVKG